MHLEGWPKSSGEELWPYWVRRLELSTHDGCQHCVGRENGDPPPAREYLLVELHEGHSGVSGMKALMQSLMWRPGMDHEIKDVVRHCTECQWTQTSPPSTLLHPLTCLWAGLHCRSYWWQNVLNHIPSGWKCDNSHIPDNDTAPENIVCKVWTTWVLNIKQWPPIYSGRVLSFCKLNGICHIQVVLYHPASDGLAARAVQTFERGIPKFKSGTIEDRVARFLMQYWMMQLTTTGSSPAELLLGCQLRTRSYQAWNGKWQLSGWNRKRAREHTFIQTDRVHVRNFGRGENLVTWLFCPDIWSRLISSDVRLVRRHQNQIMERTDVALPDTSSGDDDNDVFISDDYTASTSHDSTE